MYAVSMTKNEMTQSNLGTQPAQKWSLILRLWHADNSLPADWRVSVEIMETGKRIGFAYLEQFFAFLIDFIESDGDNLLIDLKE